MTGRKTTLPDGACWCSELLEDRPGRCAPSPKPACSHQSQDFRAWHASAHVPVELCAARLAGARCHVGAPQHLQARDGRGRGRPRRAFRHFSDFMERCALVHPPLVRLACSRSCDIHPFASAQMCRGEPCARLLPARVSGGRAACRDEIEFVYPRGGRCPNGHRLQHLGSANFND